MTMRRFYCLGSNMMRECSYWSIKICLRTTLMIYVRQLAWKCFQVCEVVTNRYSLRSYFNRAGLKYSKQLNMNRSISFEVRLSNF